MVADNIILGLDNNNYKLKINMKKLPIYKCKINEENDGTGVNMMSLVDDPAVQKEFLLFAENKACFAADKVKHIVTGVAILADTPIYRRDSKLGEFYMTFEASEIRKIVEKFFRKNNLSNVNLQHETPVTDCYLFESYIVDRSRGILPSAFSDIPDGSWCVSYKITNDKVWDELVKTNNLNGFSIEIDSYLELTSKTQFNNEKDIELELLNELI